LTPSPRKSCIIRRLESPACSRSKQRCRNPHNPIYLCLSGVLTRHLCPAPTISARNVRAAVTPAATVITAVTRHSQARYPSIAVTVRAIPPPVNHPRCHGDERQWEEPAARSLVGAGSGGRGQSQPVSVVFSGSAPVPCSVTHCDDRRRSVSVK
jgi:hypothetical protein